MTVKGLADRLEVRAKDVLKKLIDKRLMMTINTTLDPETATMIALEFGADVKLRTFEEEMVKLEAEETKAEDLVPRAPVITVMGHVDHGKTTLLDAIRNTRVAEGEAGGITQHIGAYAVEVKNRRIVFLDTPGHEAFTMMRARGASVTDVIILVVAADDGVMPQTQEAIDHARAADVPILVAINKIDKADANPDRVKQELAERDLTPEDWGGQTVMVPVSAKNEENLESLLEMILLITEMGEHKANPKRIATGTVLEAKVDRGRGAVATVLIQDGTLRVGDNFIAGTIVGRVRALIDDRGNQLKDVGPSSPVEVLGLTGVPKPGDAFQGVADAAKSKQIALLRQNQAKEKARADRGSRLTLESLQQQLSKGGAKELPIIIKADVQGSSEVLAQSLEKLGDDRVKIRIIHTGVGAVNESDVLLASTSNAVIIAFNVRPDRNANVVAAREGVDIRKHSVIYHVTDEIKQAMAGLLDPTFKEQQLGLAEVREVFKIPKFGSAAGCIVTEGRITRSGEAKVRLVRDSVVIHEGKIGSLRRFKDDATEVKSGVECGIAFERYSDIKVGDVIESFTVETIVATVQ
jgi:translation initiation factor IF-2